MYKKAKSKETQGHVETEDTKTQKKTFIQTQIHTPSQTQVHTDTQTQEHVNVITQKQRQSTQSYPLHPQLF